MKRLEQLQSQEAPPARSDFLIWPWAGDRVVVLGGEKTARVEMPGGADVGAVVEFLSKKAWRAGTAGEGVVVLGRRYRPDPQTGV